MSVGIQLIFSCHTIKIDRTFNKLACLHSTFKHRKHAKTNIDGGGRKTRFSRSPLPVSAYQQRNPNEDNMSKMSVCVYVNALNDESNFSFSFILDYTCPKKPGKLHSNWQLLSGFQFG